MMAQETRLNFANLPLIEVAVRAHLAAPHPLKFAIINRIHEELQTDFPLLEELDRFETPHGVQEVTVSPGQLLGAVFTGNANGIVITVQGQIVVARWLKEVGANKPPYPRFDAIRNALWRAVVAFRVACDDTLAQVAVVNLTYVNLLQISHSEPVLSRYFSPFAQVKAAERAKLLHKVEASWRDSTDMDFRYELERVKTKIGDEEVEGYRLTTAGGLRLPPSTSEAPALDGVHDRLQVFFRDLLSEHALREWQLKEASIA